ncbi:hypothetical protein MNAN1_000529 [Malassezia nana]|uniref:Uncharacterized protein n=1 Tax=Malassezia nana TaxID=180528 RepID=A0AAF0J149_9BASI|nr:hypothetical protein MNAN1_000529 [Malassezia nana]
MIATPTLEAPPPSAGREAPAWIWAPSVPPTHAPSAASSATSPYWDMGLPTGQSPHRYMMYRPDTEPGVAPAPNLMPTPTAMYPFPMAMHTDPASVSRMSNPAVGGYAMVPLSGFPMLDAPSFPMLMQVPPVPPYTMPGGDRAPDADGRPTAFPDTWAPISHPEVAAPESRMPNMDDLLALSRQAQLEADGGPNANVFVCPHCEKRYVGKHARSIWRRHLQDKHAIPLSVQPRRTRWDRDANRPRNAAERRERMLESKRRWARKKREQERRLAAAESESVSASDVAPTDAAVSVTPPDDAPQAPAPAPAPARETLMERVPPSESNVRARTTTVARPPSACAGTGGTVPPPAAVLHPTPRRALAPRDMNVMASARRNELAKSPSMLDAKMFMPSPMQSTPLRHAFAHMSAFPMPSPTESRLLPESARRPPPGMPPLSAKRASKGARGDQFSSPQHLNLTQSLGLAPHSSVKGSSHYGGLYGTHGAMTPMGATGTPLGRMPLGLTPTIGGLLRGSTGLGDVSGSGFLGASDLSGCMMGLPSLDSPRRSSSRRGLRTSGGFHSSSERDDDAEEDDGELRIVSPSLRQRVRGASKATLHPTPSKNSSPLCHTTSAPRPRTPRRTPRLR